MPSMPAEQFMRSIDPPGGNGDGGGGGSFIPPLWLVKVDDSNVKVTFGTVSEFEPTGANANIDVSGTDGTWSIYIDVTINSAGVPTAVAVGSGTTGVPAPTSTDGYFLNGEVDVASGVITAVRSNMAFAQAFVVCGRDTSNPTTTPGTYYLTFGSSETASGGGGGDG